MAHSQDNQIPEDLDTAATVSDEVIATYVGDAAMSVTGIVELHASSWKGLSARMRETHSQPGVVIRHTPPAGVDVEVHARVAWDVYIPELAREVEETVRRQVTALLNIDLSAVTLFVDEIEGPMEVGAIEEG
jgi:uncharacterized alkaline shock family protein YloU